jgi:opacity protein-like surface antigen
MLKKLSFTLLGLILGSSSLVAQESYGLYAGGAYAATNLELSIDGINEARDEIQENDVNNIFLFAGYDMNKNMAIEGRYYLNTSDITLNDDSALSSSYKAQTIALYAKPKIDMGFFTLYGLVGLTYNNYSLNELFGGDTDDTLFSWGAGTQFNLTPNIGFFVDYTDLGESDTTVTSNLSSWNLGIHYQF